MAYEVDETMNTPHVSAQLPVRFQYPAKAWGLPAFYLLLLLFLYVLFYGGLFYGKSFPPEFRGFFFLSIAGYLIAACVYLWEWPVYLFSRNRGIVLDEEGVTVHGRFAPWKDLERIDPGPFPFWRDTMVRLRVRRETPRFWSFDNLTHPRTLNLEPYPFVYRSLLPAIVAHSPGLSVAPRVTRLMERPESAGGFRTGLVLLALPLYAVFLASFLWNPFYGVWEYMIRSLLLLNLAVYLSLLLISFARTTRERFAQAAFLGPMLCGFAGLLHPFTDAGWYAFETLVGTGCAACILAMILLPMPRSCNGVARIAVAVVLLAAAFGINRIRAWSTWTHTDISAVFHEDDPGISPVWGRGGVYLGAFCATEKFPVLHVPSFDTVDVPESEGTSLLLWLDRDDLIRQIRNGEAPDGLRVFTFTTGMEADLPAASEFGVSRRRPVSPKGRILAWVDKAEDNGIETLRLWDLRTGSEARSPRPLPEGIRWSHGSASWVGEDEVVLYGKAKADEKEERWRLHLLRINVARKTTTRFSSDRACEGWYPTFDFRFAFGVGTDETDRSGPWLIDLHTNTGTSLHPGPLPLALPTSDRAFRVLEREDASWLMELDLAEGRERPLHRVPDGLALAGISGDGTSALLTKSFLSITPTPAYLLLHLPTGKRHILRMPGLMAVTPSARMSASIAGASPFSPEGRRIVLQSFTMGGGSRTCLFTIPDGWSK